MIDLDNIEPTVYGVYYQNPRTGKDSLQYPTYSTELKAKDSILTYLPSERSRLTVHHLLRKSDVKTVISFLENEIKSLRGELAEAKEVNQSLIDEVNNQKHKIGTLQQYLDVAHPRNSGLALLYSAANALPACNLFAAIMGGIQDFQATQAQLDDARAEVKRLKDFEILYTKFRTDVIATMKKNGEVLDEQLFDQALAHKYLEGDVDG